MLLIKIVRIVSARREDFAYLNVFVDQIVLYLCVGVLVRVNNNVKQINVYVIKLKMNAFQGYV